MIGMPRSVINAKKANRSTATTLKSCYSNTSNPQIDYLVFKLNAMTDQVALDIDNPLNLVQWKRTKYWPTQSENRLRIQNTVSLKKAQKIQVRPRTKPSKRQSKSMELNKELSLPYKQHYQKIVEQFRWKEDDYESQEEQRPVQTAPCPTSKGFRFYDSVKKYKKVTQFIQQKIEEQKSMISEKSKIEKYKEYKKNRLSCQTSFKTDKNRIMLDFNDQQSNLKVESIVKKWRPGPIVEKKFTPSDLKKYKPKRYSMKEVRIPCQLPLQTPRHESTINSASQSPLKMDSELGKK